jgi:hypothetical protein
MARNYWMHRIKGHHPEEDPTKFTKIAVKLLHKANYMHCGYAGFVDGIDKYTKETVEAKINTIEWSQNPHSRSQIMIYFVEMKDGDIVVVPHPINTSLYDIVKLVGEPRNRDYMRQQVLPLEAGDIIDFMSNVFYGPCWQVEILKENCEKKDSEKLTFFTMPATSCSLNAHKDKIEALITK